jgi:hypothetical protein
MDDKISKMSCGAIIALAVVIGFLWIAILYAGVPLAIVGCGVGYYIYNQNSGIETKKARGNVKNSYWVMGCAAILGVASLAGNVLTDQGPFGQLRFARAHLDHSEIKVTSYDALCGGGDNFNKNCDGKFIIWDGRISSVANGDANLEIPGGQQFRIFNFGRNKIDIIEYQKVRVSGYLGYSILHSTPKIDNEIIKALESKEAVNSRSDRHADNLSDCVEFGRALGTDSYEYRSCITSASRDEN